MNQSKSRKVLALLVLATVAFFFIARNGFAANQQGTTTGPADLKAFQSGEYQFPGEEWFLIEDPETIGWSAERLREAEDYFETIDSAAVMVLHRGVLISAWGDTPKRYFVQSVRKSLLSALYGVYTDEGVIDISMTLENLGVDDSESPLTTLQKQATIEHLLQSSSGIDHSALYDSFAWKDERAALEEVEPGSSWIYNLWDFNTLGTIFEQETELSIAEAFQTRLAEPLQMQDFRIEDVQYLNEAALAERIMGNHSDHNAYGFKMSARDLARFGLLYLNNGQWIDRQLISESWITASTQNVVKIRRQGFGYYGYSWWVDDGDVRSFPNAKLTGLVYYADGSRGHMVVIVPDFDLVVVHLVATQGGLDSWGQISRSVLGTPEVSFSELGQLVKLIFAAHPDG